MTDIVFKHALHEVVQGHEPFLGPLAENTHQTTLQVQIRHAQITKFRHAQSCRIQQLKHAAVALAASFAHVGLRQHFFHFIAGQHFGQVLRQLGVVHQLRGIGLNDAFLHGKVKKSPQGGQTPRQRSTGILACAQPCKVKKDLLLVGLHFRDAAARELLTKEKKILEVLAVGKNGLLRQAALGQQMVLP